MALLAAHETSGRARFMRKLMLVDVCTNAGRMRLARTVLEELNQQITEYKLIQWESWRWWARYGPDCIGSIRRVK